MSGRLQSSAHTSWGISGEMSDIETGLPHLELAVQSIAQGHLGSAQPTLCGTVRGQDRAPSTQKNAHYLQ